MGCIRIELDRYFSQSKLSGCFILLFFVVTIVFNEMINVCGFIKLILRKCFHYQNIKYLLNSKVNSFVFSSSEIHDRVID